jgi:hypothetical protein
MSRLFAAATALFVAAASWSAAAQPQTSTVASVTVAKKSGPRLLPGTHANVLTTIQGTALGADGKPSPNTFVRLRDARHGAVVDPPITDQAGMFSFRGVEQGSYVVEIMGNDRKTPLAASQILSVNSGETVMAIVKLPLHVLPFAGILSSSIAPSAALIASQAAATGIAAVVPTAPVSPNQ